MRLPGFFVCAPANPLEADPAAGPVEVEGVALCFASAVSLMPSLGIIFSEASLPPTLDGKVDSNARSSRSAFTLTSGLPNVN